MKSLSIVLFALFLSLEVVAQSPALPVNLKCEYSVRPLGIDQAVPRFSWQLADGRQGARQNGYIIEVGMDSASLLKGQADMWNSGKVQSAMSNGIIYAGKTLSSRKRYYWRVTIADQKGKWSQVSAITSFETGIFTYPEWKGDWISDGQDTAFKPAPYFRKTFSVHGAVRSARAYICGLGYYEMHINGQKVGDHVLDPAYSRYDKTDYYCVYDIMPYLKEGANALGVLLGNGWYNEQSYAVWYFHKAPWRARPRLLCNVYVEYADGTEERVVTDSSWRTAPSPIVFNNIYSGEYIDHRLEQRGWDDAGLVDTGWQRATVTLPVMGALRVEMVPPIRIKKEIKPVSMKRWSDSFYVFDLGQNFSGLSRLRVSGERGTVISVKHGEELSPAGRLNQANISVHYRFADTTEAAQTDQYVLSGEGIEEFVQHFTYHGYRYVEVKADRPIRLAADGLTGLFIHTDVTPIGSFTCSDTLLNRIYTAGIWSYLSNMQGIPTDCPQREKNGWTGDGHIGAEIGLYNFDAILFYEKWIRDFIDEQEPGGAVAPIIPTSGWGYNFHGTGAGPAWDAALLFVPWYVYEYYGDDYLIRTYYEHYKRYVDFLRFRADSSGIQHFGLGDWSFYKSRTPVPLTSTCYYYQLVWLLSRFAKITGHTEDASFYGSLAETVRNAINAQFLDPATGKYANGTQTAFSIALCQGIVPDSLRERVVADLVSAVHAGNDHLDVGLIGSKYLLNALSLNGQGDLAYTIASQRTQPSWGWWLLQGETTFQEEWGLGPSRNHVFLGEIVAWFYKALVGIQVDPDRPGFTHVIIRPCFVKGLDWAKGEVETVRGTVGAAWRRESGKVVLEVEVPPGSTATVYFAEEGKEVGHDVGAGTYRFKEGGR